MTTSPDPDDREPEPPNGFLRFLEENRAVIGVLFALVLAAGAVYMIDRMRHYAALGDCAFVSSPRCREFLR